jgi:hypothetical protein
MMIGRYLQHEKKTVIIIEENPDGGIPVRKLLLTISFILLTAYTGLAADIPANQEDRKNPYANYFGLDAGFVSGLGLSYRYWPDKIGIQVNLLPILSKNYSLFSIGVSALYSIRRMEWGTFLLYAGGNYFQDKDVPFFKEKSTVGGGFGVEFGGANIVFDIQAGFQIILSNPLELWPTVEVGAFYRI